MIMETELKLYLESLAEHHPKEVIERLSIGDKVQKSAGLIYEIDDINIDKKLGNFSEGAIPYGQIYQTLKNSQGGIYALFNGLSEAPFSRIYNARIGECLEKAILVQLSAQRGRKSFLINGNIAEDDKVGVGSHAYNVVFKNGKPFLVDVQNPFGKDSTGKITLPYIAPIIGVKEGYADFIVPKEWKQGRTYSIF